MNDPNPFTAPRFVGRFGPEGEMSLLGMELLQASEGDARTVIVDGASGVGKSRLLREFGNLALSRGCLVFHLSVREHQSLADLISGLGQSMLATMSSADEVGKSGQGFARFFAEGARRVADWAVKLGPALSAAPSDPVRLAAWFAAGTVAVPMLSRVLEELPPADSPSPDTPSRACVSGTFDALEAMNEQLARRHDGPAALVLVFDQWDHLKRRVPAERQAYEDFAVALHERLLTWAARRVLPVFGVRSESRAETIGQLYNNVNVRPLLVRPLSQIACSDLLCQPTGGQSPCVAFDAPAAQACYGDCQGNAEHLVLLASEVWAAARMCNAEAITLPFYQHHAPVSIARSVACRVERFQREYQDHDAEALSLLSALADGAPDHAWHPEHLVSAVSPGQPELVIDMLKVLCQAEVGLLEYRPAHGRGSGAYWFQHDIRWRGLRQWCHPEESSDERDAMLVFWKLRDWLIAKEAQLDPPERITLLLRLAQDALRLREASTRRLAVEKLLPLLNDPGRDVRARTVMALGDIGSPEAVAALRVALHDEDAEVSQAAIGQLAERRLPGLIPDFLAVLTDTQAHASLRLSAIRALERMPSAEVATGLGVGLRDPDVYVRRHTVEALAGLDLPEAQAALVVALQDRDGQVRRRAMEALHRVAPDASLHELAALLKDGNPGVRRDAALMLGRIGSSEAVPALFSALDDRHSDVVIAAIRALCGIPSAAVVPRLARMAQHSDLTVVRAALSALRGIGSYEAIVAILRLTHSSDPDVREVAQRRLKRGEEDATLRHLIRALQDDRDVRRAAALAFGWVRWRKLVLGLAAALHDQNADSRRLAIERLVEVTCPQIAISLQEVSSDQQIVWQERHSVRSRLRSMARTLRLPDVTAALAAAVHDRNPEVRESASAVQGNLQRWPVDGS